ncbi:gp55, partial [Burkholderia pseudomallei 1710a]
MLYKTTKPEIPRMIKQTTAAVLLALTLAACGGGDDSPAASGPAIKLTYSGAPLVSPTNKARMMAAADIAASSPVTPDSQDTITRLQDAFKARGADIGVYPGIINGSKLHDIVMSENNGVGPTNAEISAANVNISTWTLVNFQFDDMRGYIDTPEKAAMVAQFRHDIQVYSDREYMKGNVVFVPLALGSCLPSRTDSQTAVEAFNNIARSVGAFNAETMAVPPTVDPAHMGADCQTPDSAAQQAYFDHVVDFLMWHYEKALDTINKCKHNPEAI